MWTRACAQQWNDSVFLKMNDPYIGKSQCKGCLCVTVADRSCYSLTTFFFFCCRTTSGPRGARLRWECPLVEAVRTWTWRRRRKTTCGPEVRSQQHWSESVGGAAMFPLQCSHSCSLKWFRLSLNIRFPGSKPTKKQMKTISNAVCLNRV